MFLFLFKYYVVSYFENIPSLQSSANALTVAHVSVSILKKKSNKKCDEPIVENASRANHWRKKLNSCKGTFSIGRIRL